MKSVKQGRKHLIMGRLGAVVAIVFGVIWTIAATPMNAPFPFRCSAWC